MREQKREVHTDVSYIIYPYTSFLYNGDMGPCNLPSLSVFSGVSVNMAHFCFVLFALVFFHDGTFENGLIISGNIPGLAFVQS